MSCCLRYIGQNGRCKNTQITEHERNVRIKAIHSHLILHVCSDYNNCEVWWDNSTVLKRERNPEKKVYSWGITYVDYGKLVSILSLSSFYMSQKLLGLSRVCFIWQFLHLWHGFLKKLLLATVILLSIFVFYCIYSSAVYYIVPLCSKPLCRSSLGLSPTVSGLFREGITTGWPAH